MQPFLIRGPALYFSEADLEKNENIKLDIIRLSGWNLVGTLVGNPSNMSSGPSLFSEDLFFGLVNPVYLDPQTQGDIQVISGPHIVSKSNNGRSTKVGTKYMRHSVRTSHRFTVHCTVLFTIEA